MVLNMILDVKEIDYILECSRKVKNQSFFFKNSPMNQTLPITLFSFAPRNAGKIEFHKILKNVTKGSYDQDLINKLQEKREKIINVLSTPNMDEFLGASADYLSLFQALIYTPSNFHDTEQTENVPLLQDSQKDGNYSKFRKIFTFQWSTSLKKSQQIMINDALFELYSVLYNIATW